MSILYSIPVHECYECIKQMCDGILFFDKNAIIVLHISNSQSMDFYKGDNERVFVNPKQFETIWGCDFSGIHISNYLYVKDKFKISDIVFLTSNCLMLRNPAEYIKDYDCGFSEFQHDCSKLTPPLLVKDYQIQWAGDLHKTKEFSSILEELNTTKIYGCMIDGGYVKSHIMDKLVYFCQKNYKYEKLNLLPGRLEEQLFPTIACNLTNKISDALLYYCDQNLEGFQNLLKREDVFFNKRISRDINNPIRQYYNKIIYEKYPY